MYLLKENHLCYKQEYVAHCFPVRIELVFTGILPANGIIQRGNRLCLLQTDLVSWVDETHTYLQRNPFVIEAIASRTLFPCMNWVSFWKQYFLQIVFVPKRPIQLRWWNTWMCWRKPPVWEEGLSHTLLPYKNWVSFWKEYFLSLRCFWIYYGCLCFN
jgi:hypothetical protein